MSLATIRLEMMTRYAQLSGVVVPQDPLPTQIADKSIIIFPRIGESNLIGRGSTRTSVSIRVDDVMQIEYHRRIPYEELGTTFPDISTMIDTIEEVAWGELAGGKFNGSVLNITRVALLHFGAIGWNEWTFGARLEVAFTHLKDVSS